MEKAYTTARKDAIIQFFFKRLKRDLSILGPGGTDYLRDNTLILPKLLKVTCGQWNRNTEMMEHFSCNILGFEVFMHTNYGENYTQGYLDTAT